MVFNMRKDVNLFDKSGANALYELIRTRNHPNDKQAIEYWNNLYNINSQYLDKKFVSEFPNSTEACLWELTLSKFLRSSPNIELLKDKDFGRKNKSKPDFCFLANNKKFYLEATIVNPGQYSELNVKLEDVLGSSCRVPREEYKEKICAALNNKIQRFNTGYKDIINENDGYIIAISSSPIGMHINPNDPLIEASCLFGLSERQYEPNTGKIYFNEEISIKKKNNDNKIDTNYFVTLQYDFISGVLISRNLSIFYPKLEGLEKVIPELKDEGIYYHNPKAKNQLPRQALLLNNQFDSKEEVTHALMV